jgi:hypothetical protein
MSPCPPTGKDDSSGFIDLKCRHGIKGAVIDPFLSICEKGLKVPSMVLSGPYFSRYQIGLEVPSMALSCLELSAQRIVRVDRFYQPLSPWRFDGESIIISFSGSNYYFIFIILSFILNFFIL